MILSKVIPGMTNKALYASSKQTILEYKYFSVVFLFFWVTVNGIEDLNYLFSPLYAGLVSIPVLLLIFNLIFLKNVKVTEQGLFVIGILSTRKYAFSDISDIRQTHYFRPKAILITFKNQRLLNRFVITLPECSHRDIFLSQTEEITQYIRGRINK